MKIHNLLPHLMQCLHRWETIPTEEQFIKEYAEPLRSVTGGFFDDYYEDLLELDWAKYREHALLLDPVREEQAVVNNLNRVETLFEFKLEGEICLIGAFERMDGFARFNRGRHTVFLGVDESHLKRDYLDILTVHELTHVARESRPEVWEGFGLNPRMSREEFLASQPVIEHLMGEGFSCVVSEILLPGLNPWLYVYQSQKTYEHILQQMSQVDRRIKNELQNPQGYYGNLYGYQPGYAHYLWAWQWVKEVLRTHADEDPRKLVTRCSKEFISHALSFSFPSSF